MRLLVSSNSELLRHLATAPFRNLSMEIVVVTGGLEAIETARRERPALALLDAEMADLSGYEAARAIKHADEECRLVLVVGSRINARQMRLVAESGCDEVLVVPTGADQLFDVVAAQLALPRRAARRFPLDLAVVGQSGRRPFVGRVTNLSVAGARLVVNERIDKGDALRLEIRPEGEPPISVEAVAVWVEAHGRGSALGASFDAFSTDDRRRLVRLTQWDVIQGADRTRVVVRGDITEAASFDDLGRELFGKVDFDMSQVGYMDSIGVREWIDFIDRAPIRDYEFHACSVAFVLQASLVEGVLGEGTVVSLFAPYACESCGQREERLLQTSSILSGSRRPPAFACSRCDGRLILDDFPDRYLAFLRGVRAAESW